MIPANELRLGNYVIISNAVRGFATNAKGEDKIVKITSIDSIGINKNPTGSSGGGIRSDYDAIFKDGEFGNASNVQDMLKIEGIPLTSEILENIGFKKSIDFRSNWEYEADRSFEIQKTNGGYELFGSEWTHSETFHFLHQLQNLFFALNQEELKVEL